MTPELLLTLPLFMVEYTCHKCNFTVRLPCDALSAGRDVFCPACATDEAGTIRLLNGNIVQIGKPPTALVVEVAKAKIEGRNRKIKEQN